MIKGLFGIFKYKDLFWQLTSREVKARYRRSILGYTWAILVPIIHLVVLSLVFSNLIVTPSTNVPYPIFLFVALIPWIFFSSSITSATASIIGNTSLINKVKLPREILPISAVSARFIDFGLGFLVLMFFILAYGQTLHLSLLLIPLIFFVQVMLVLGISFFLSATNVFFRDIENVLSTLLTIWMYATPIVYSLESIPASLQPILYINPMATIINSYRGVILNGKLPVGDFLLSLVLSVTILILGYIYFTKQSKYFADVT